MPAHLLIFLLGELLLAIFLAFLLLGVHGGADVVDRGAARLLRDGHQSLQDRSKLRQALRLKTETVRRIKGTYIVIGKILLYDMMVE